ncbi:unnamed protein product [Brachionus calyciflorus]|uniref:GRB2 n=1 Tax=Brachionus calyciflorus TaxID=104777 RepID=A0A813UDT3_9BILA|nr:unnamed protein product [Brachionus calyciflorus]
MEAVAKYAYTASSPSELSFNAGDTMKIIPYDEFWCRGRINNKEGYVPKSYITEKPHPWFKGRITREESEELLLKRDKSTGMYKHVDGAFLIRHSENSPEDFSASVKYNDAVQHFKIFFREYKYYIWAKPFDSFNELVEYYRTTSISRSQQIFLKEMSEEGKLYQAAYDFEAEYESELSMKKGDIIRVTETSDPNWWSAANEKNGKTGIVPCQYLTPLK